MPKRLWKRDIGVGHSSILVDDGGQRLYTMYRSGDDEVVISLDANTGQTLWEFRYPAPFLSGMNMDVGPGPHATALLVGGRLYATGVTGKLHCLDARTGKLRWKRGLLEEMGGTVMVRGYSASPIAYRDTVIVTVGGPGHALAALDQKTGAVVWTRQDFKNSHASPILIRLDGTGRRDGQDHYRRGSSDRGVALEPSARHHRRHDRHNAGLERWKPAVRQFSLHGGMVPVAKSGPPILASRVGLLRASGWSHELLLSGLSISLAMVI